jgi:hypothetical protein
VPVVSWHLIGMPDDDAMATLEKGFQEDRAYALGRAGRTLERAMDALEAGERERDQLLDAAADAVWSYMIVREAAGFHDHRGALAMFRVPPAVMARVGIVRRSPP